MRHATILVAILAFVPLASATAQMPIRRGERVRVTRLPICPPTSTICVGPSRQSVGTFWAWEGDSLILESNGSALALALDSVTRLEVRHGIDFSRVGHGAIIGGSFLGSLALMVGLAATHECGGPGFDLMCGATAGNVLLATAVGAGVGAAVGSVIGLVATIAVGESWERVGPPGLRNVSVLPQRDGRFGLGLSGSF